MSESNGTTVLDRILDPVAECLTPDVAQRIADLNLPSELQVRLDDLAGGANAGTLTVDELQEYREHVEGLDLLGILKAKARLAIRRQTP
jgi:hypothetical protein